MPNDKLAVTDMIAPRRYRTEKPASGSGPGDGGLPLPARDPLRDEEWFAQQIGKSAQWCRKHRTGLPHHTIGESVRYDDHCVDLYREQTFHPVSPIQSPRSSGDLMVPTSLSARRSRTGSRTRR